MTEKVNARTYSVKDRILFGISAIPDQMTYQAFNLFVFTYYFAVVRIGTIPLMIGFIIWSLWNSINDPFLGALSDRTKFKGKWGKRKFYLIISIIPLSLWMIFLFTVPIATEAKVVEYAYFLVIILTFEFWYTLWDCNVNALFPEMFPTQEERSKTNIFVKGFTVIGIIFSSLPSLILSPLAPLTGTPEELALIKMNYILGGTMLCVITILVAIPFIIKGIREHEEDQVKFEKRPSFLGSLKICFKNREFLKFTFSNMLVWYVFNTLMMILPLFAVHVLGIGEGSFMITISLLFALGVAAFMLPVHAKFGQKIGMRNAAMLTLGVWIILLFLFVLINPGDILVGIIVTGIQGISLSGCLFYVDILHGSVIDEDALNFGVKRSASFYGVNAFIHRFSTILAILTIGLVFQGTSWAGGYKPTDVTNIVIGIKLIMFLFPAIGCVIAITILSRFKLHGERLERIKEELKKANIK